MRGKTKRLAPDDVRGEAQIYAPRFHPACRKRRAVASSGLRPERSGNFINPERVWEIPTQSEGLEPCRKRAQRDILPLVSFCNGKAPSRSSRAAPEWYGRRFPQDPSTKRAPLYPAQCGFFSVSAILYG